MVNTAVCRVANVAFSRGRTLAEKSPSDAVFGGVPKEWYVRVHGSFATFRSKINKSWSKKGCFFLLRKNGRKKIHVSVAFGILFRGFIEQ